MNYKLVVIGIIAILVLIPVVLAEASQETRYTFFQTQASVSPTPAPSKTATSIPQFATNTPVTPQASAQQAAQPTAQATPFTQKDLSVLTGNIQRPNGLAWYDNKLYTSCSGDWTVYEIDPATGTTTQYIYGVKNAHTIYANTDADGRLSLWIPDFQNNNLVFISKGVSQVIASNLKGPWGITPLNDKAFLVTNLLGNTLTMIGMDGKTQDLISGLRSPAGLVTNGEFLYIANSGSARRAVEAFKLDDISTSAEPVGEESSSPLVTGLQNVTSLVMASDNRLYFSYALGTRGVVGRVDPAVCQAKGGCSNTDVEIVLYTELAAPLAGLTISPDMRLFVHSIFSPDIYWVQLGDNVD